MDSTDGKILELLKKDGRMGFVELGKKVGLTEGAVRARVKRMVSGGFIEGFTVVLRSSFKALVLARIDPRLSQGAIGTIRKFSQDLFETSGTYDLAIFLEAEGLSEINRLVDKIRAVKGVLSTDTLLKLA